MAYKNIKKKHEHKRGKEFIAQRQRRNALRLRYGLTPEQYDKLFEQQNGCCAICGRHQSESKLALGIDHCHKTGKVRRLLCPPCNTCLGWFEKYGEAIIQYLK